MKHNLLSLDQSSRVTGWAFFSEGKLVDSGTFTVTGDDIGQRLVTIKSNVLKLIKKYEINEIIFEDIQMQGNIINNVQTFKILAEVFGVLWETFEELGIRNSAVLSTVWKSALGIKGAQRAEQKRNAQTFVLNTYDKKVSQDESDAICIGTYKIKNKAEQEEDFNWD